MGGSKMGPNFPGLKVGGDKLSPNWDSRGNRLLGKEISSFLHQNIMGRTRDLRVSGHGTLKGNKPQRNLVTLSYNVQDPIIGTDLLPILEAEPQSAPQGRLSKEGIELTTNPREVSNNTAD